METIEFNKKIYTLKAVQKAIEKFTQMAIFTIKETKNDIEVKMDKIDQEVKAVLPDEFANYVLGLMS